MPDPFKREVANGTVQKKTLIGTEKAGELWVHCLNLKKSLVSFILGGNP